MSQKDINKDLWRDWSDSGRALFKSVYADMADQKWIRDTDNLLPRSAWEVIRHNAAFLAAVAISEREDRAAKRAARPQKN